MVNRILFGALLLWLRWHMGDWWRAQVPATVNALYYNNRNECNSVYVEYDFIFSKENYTLKQEIWLRPTQSVSECFFYMSMEFQLYKAELKVRGRRHGIVLEFMEDYFIGRIMNGSWVEGTTYQLTLAARKPFRKAEQGIVFRTYRHTETRVK